MKFSIISLILATLTTGIMSGTFFIWSFSVTEGIGKLSAHTYLAAFQSMNRTILNPLFFVVFIGAAILIPLTVFLHFKTPISPRLWMMIGAALFYCIGSFALTMFGNVPMNNSLDALQIDSLTLQQAKAFRLGFEDKWNQFNMIRTITSTIAFLLLILACLNPSND